MTWRGYLQILTLHACSALRPADQVHHFAYVDCHDRQLIKYDNMSVILHSFAKIHSLIPLLKQGQTRPPVFTDRDVSLQKVANKSKLTASLAESVQLDCCPSMRFGQPRPILKRPLLHKAGSCGWWTESLAGWQILA